MKVITVRKEHLLLGIYLIIIFIGVANYKNIETVHTFSDNSKKIIVIDAGHGGSDAGKVAGKIYEKDINLAIAEKLKKKLEAMGFKTVMVRKDDNMPKNKQDEMWQRQKIANASEGDIFVSIHQNSSPNASAKGFQIYYFKKSKKSKMLADNIYNSIKADVNPSTKFPPIENDDYYVLRTTKMPAVLVECGFLSNEGERWLLTTEDYQEKMVSGIANGIEDYFKN